MYWPSDQLNFSLYMGYVHSNKKKQKNVEMWKHVSMKGKDERRGNRQCGAPKSQESMLANLRTHHFRVLSPDLKLGHQPKILDRNRVFSSYTNTKILDVELPKGPTIRFPRTTPKTSSNNLNISWCESWSIEKLGPSPLLPSLCPLQKYREY